MNALLCSLCLANILLRIWLGLHIFRQFQDVSSDKQFHKYLVDNSRGQFSLILVCYTLLMASRGNYCCCRLKGGLDALFNIVINYISFVENILSFYIAVFEKSNLDIKLSCICIDLNTQLINVQLVNFVLQTIAVIKRTI